jgi:16S rRNA (cytidine1402-2'-O)-methyltransferase
VVSTPIGHLGDITLRAIDTLRGVDFILAEDTRHVRTLLDRYEVRTPVRALHEHNEARSVDGILERLRRGECGALVSDAGTPLLSDPGSRLVAAVWAAGLRVSPVPGPSALTAALAAAGLDAPRFTFFGFLPRTGRERQDAIAELSAMSHPGALYEAPARLAKTLRELDVAGCGARDAVVARELTKRFEEFRRGTVAELAAYYATSPPRGEVVVILSGRPEEGMSEAVLRQRVEQLRAEGRTARDVSDVLTREHGVPRNLAYRLAHGR